MRPTLQAAPLTRADSGSLCGLAALAVLAPTRPSRGGRTRIRRSRSVYRHRRQGHTFPGAVVPFGMVQLSPDTQLKTRKEGYGWAAGYRHDDSDDLRLLAHALLRHRPFRSRRRAGHADRRRGASRTRRSIDQPGSGYFSRFSHDDEKAEPGYYAVTLSDYGIRAELTAGERVGVHRYTFPQGKPAHVLVDLRPSMYDYPGKVLVVAPAPARGRHRHRLPRNARLGAGSAAVFRHALLEGAERPRAAQHRAGHPLQGLRAAGRERSDRARADRRACRWSGVVDFPAGTRELVVKVVDLAGQRGQRHRQPRCRNARLRISTPCALRRHAAWRDALGVFDVDAPEPMRTQFLYRASITR